MIKTNIKLKKKNNKNISTTIKWKKKWSITNVNYKHKTNFNSSCGMIYIHDEI